MNKYGTGNRDNARPRQRSDGYESLEEQSDRVSSIGPIFSCVGINRPCAKSCVGCMRLIDMGNIDQERKCHECGIVTILDSTKNICFDCWSTLEVRIAEEEE